MSHYRILGRPLATICLASLATSAALAQATSGSPSEEPVRLSDFSVTSTPVTGYVASESTTGTRVATKIADLPFVVNVITSDFMKDFDFFDVTSDMAYTSSLSGVDSQGNFNLRGFTASFYLWNGFYRLGLVDRANIERIEVIKGNNAAIYGQTTPSGMLNIVTKQPFATPTENLEFTVGSEDLRRFEADINTPLGSLGKVNFANRLDVAGLDRTYDNPYSWLHTRLLSDAFRIRIGSDTSLLTLVEWSKRTGDPVTGEQMFVYNSVTKAYTGALAPVGLARFSQGGPNAVANRELTSVNEIFETRLNDIFSLRVAGYGYARHAYNFDTAESTQYDPALNQVVGISTKPVRDTLNEDGGALQADLLAHWSLFNNAIQNKTLLTFDYSQNWRYRIQRQVPDSVTITSTRSLAAPDYTFPDVNLFTIVTRKDKVRWDTDGVFLSDQATMLNGRLLAFAGLRFDNVGYNLNFGNQYNTKAPYALKTAGQVQHFHDDALDPQLGFNFKLTKTLAAYSSYSNSFFPNAQNAKLGNPPLGNQHGRGWDYGIKASLLKERLIFTLGGYYVNQNGLKVTVLEPDGSTDTEPAGSQNSKGLEFDSSYQVADDIAVLAGYGYVNARITRNGNDPAAVGLRPQGIPVDNGYIALKYDLQRLHLTGLSVNAGFTYDGISYPESNNSTLALKRIRLPEYYLFNAGVNYQWTQLVGGLKLTHRVRFSVKNALNREYADVNLSPGDERGFFFSYTLIR